MRPPPYLKLSFLMSIYSSCCLKHFQNSLLIRAAARVARLQCFFCKFFQTQTDSYEAFIICRQCDVQHIMFPRSNRPTVWCTISKVRHAATPFTWKHIQLVEVRTQKFSYKAQHSLKEHILLAALFHCFRQSFYLFNRLNCNHICFFKGDASCL